MNCNMIKDLIPLYIDKCCSKESAAAVEEHLVICDECRAVYDSMTFETEAVTEQTDAAPKKLDRINDFKASVLQSLLLFISFAVITVGVALEASTPSGFSNSLWALWVVVPATGFMLSLANWYFVRLYKSRRIFSNCSWLLTLGITICAYIWSCFHYEINLIGSDNLSQLLEKLSALLQFWFGPGILFTVVLCILSKVLSSLYAKMLGKE